MNLLSGGSRRALGYAGIAVSIVAGAYYVHVFITHLSRLPSIDLNTKTAIVLLLTIVMYMSIITIGGTVWYLLLRYYRQNISWFDTQVIYGQAQFGKYIPGNVAHHIGRVLLSSKYGISAQVAIGSMFLEVIWAIAAGVAVALIGSLGNSLPAISAEQLPLRYYIAIAILFVTTFLPYFLLKFIKDYLPALSERLSVISRLGLPDIKSLLMIMSLSVMTFLLVGVVLGLQAWYLFDIRDVRFFLLAGIFSWAWIAGFITPGAPAGLGVRDAVLLAALTPLYGAGVAIGLTMTLRIVTTLGDGIWFVISMLAASIERK